MCVSVSVCSICECLYMCVCFCVYVYVHICACVQICVTVHVCVYCVCTHTCSHVHTFMPLRFQEEIMVTKRLIFCPDPTSSFIVYLCELKDVTAARNKI